MMFTYVLNNVTGIILMMVTFIVYFVVPDDPVQAANQRRTADALKWVFRLFPPFCLTNGLMTMSLSVAYSFFSPNSDGTALQALDWRIAAPEVLMLAIDIPIYIIIIAAIELINQKGSWKKAICPCLRDPDVPRRRNDEDDADIMEERKRVLSGKAHESNDVVILDKLRKTFRPAKVAVRDLTLGIPNGECFGLLGINGAGKTTTLSMLSGILTPTDGTCYLAGRDVATDLNEVRHLMGFCPQFDALWPVLTGREHLMIYARIKGVPEETIHAVVEKKIVEMDLSAHCHREAGGYSGGNKRKLSVAIATIGDPAIVFLDEPSTGMDPVSRRFMWNVIVKMATQDQSCSVVLTTHSMEECEALCTRIGIMVGGRMQCLGSAQHLKSR
jgi:ABC-type multidrug transport system ATPase subunit